MAAVIYHIFFATALLSLGIYHIICTTKNYLLSRIPSDYSAKPYHQLPSSNRFLKHLQLYILIIFLSLAFIHQILISLDSDPLLKGHTPVHRFTSLQSAAVIFLFLLLSIALLLSQTSSLLPLPFSLFFAISSLIFFLQYSSFSASASALSLSLESKCDSISARISALSSLLCVILACQPRLFVADITLGSSICLQGFWVLQTGLFLYVEAFIPEGCHKLLDVVSGVEGSTKCDLEESRLRASAILDVAFVIYVMLSLLIMFFSYSIVAKSVGMRRYGSYEALPAVSTSSTDTNHVQMKTLTGTQA